MTNRRSPAAVADRAAPGRLVVGAGSALAFILTFLFRFLSAEFTNDHFMHLAEGRQVLFGEWPVRDYFDFGLPLQVLTSTATLLVSGHNLYGEALVTVAFIAAGVACTFAVSARLSRSSVVGAAAAAIAAIASPRLYNYPKVFFYVCALWAAWCYVQRPGLRRLAVFGGVVGLAFLYRHDHGVYIGIASIVLFVVVHWREPKTGVLAVARYTGVILLVAAPFLLFVQFTIGLPWYLSDLVPGAQAPAAARFTVLSLAFDASAPWISVEPPAERRFNVRWRDDLDASARTALEAKYQLVRPRPEGPSTFSYSTGDDGHANIRALVDDSAVVDTNGIDRGAGVLAVRELWYEWLQRRLPPLRTHVLPGLFRDRNALPLFQYFILAIPLFGLVAVPFAAWKGSLNRTDGAVIAMSLVLSIIVIETLVRGSPDSRLPDVAATVSVTAAWVIGRFCRSVSTAGRRARGAAALLFWIIAAWSVGTNAHAGEALDASRLLTGPSGVADQFWRMRGRLSQRPIDNWADDETGYRGLARYAFACTGPDDRVLVTWFEPIVYFYAEREFAGGRVFFDGGWHDSTRDQRFTVERLKQQRVPLVFVRDEFELMFRKYFPLVAAYMDQHYVRTAPTTHGDQVAGYQIWVDKTRQPVGTYGRLGLPCFR